MDDYISRQAAIDALKNDMASLDHIIQGMSGYDVRLDAYVSQRNQVNCDIDTISNLPPAQPEPCEDAVQWEQLERYADWFCADVSYPEFVREAKTFIKSVTPKQRTGHWIPVGMVEAVGGESAQWGSAMAYHRCSECDGQALRDDSEQEVLSKWCPHCGAKMVGVSE